jgi:hypothetical protein
VEERVVGVADSVGFRAEEDTTHECATASTFESTAHAGDILDETCGFLAKEVIEYVDCGGHW